MSKMVERVASAICVASGLDLRAVEGKAWIIFKEHARSAIEAMREPTGEMLNAVSSSEAFDQGHRGQFQGMYTLMVDAALKD